jgi:SRSO17 transposase
MEERSTCPAVPDPLEAYAARFDDLFTSPAQRRGFRDYLGGLLLPRQRNKTLTCLADTEPVVGARHREAQRYHHFLADAPWDAEKVNDRRLELLKEDPATRPHPGGVLDVDDSGDRKHGHATAHVARQYIGSRGSIQNGIVAVSTTWADPGVYYPLHAEPYTPACRLDGGRGDPEFRTKGKIAAELVGKARTAGFPFRAVVGDCFLRPLGKPRLRQRPTHHRGAVRAGAQTPPAAGPPRG